MAGFRYTREQQRAIITPLRPLPRTIKARDVIKRVTVAARWAIQMQAGRPPLAGDVRTEAASFAVDVRRLRERIQALRPWTYGSIDRELRERKRLDLARTCFVLDELYETISEAGALLWSTLQEKGRPRDEARFGFGVALYGIFADATGRKPTRSGPYEDFVRAAMGPTGVLGAGPERVAKDVIGELRGPRLREVGRLEELRRRLRGLKSPPSA